MPNSSPPTPDHDQAAMLQERLCAAQHELSSLIAANEQLAQQATEARDEAAELARALARARDAAGFDELTGLPNRLLLRDRFELAAASARRHGKRLALLFLDLGNFKKINDSLGHAAGDQVLVLTAKRLAAAVREADTVCRYGGDEFVILLTEIGEGADAVLVADHAITAIGAPCALDGHVVRVAVSVGIGVYPEDGEDFEALIRQADQAMYRAKQYGMGSYVFHGNMLQSGQSLQVSPMAAFSHPVSRHEHARSAHDQRYQELRQTNDRLMLAVLDAQQLQTAAEQAHQRHREQLALVANELRQPLAPMHCAAVLLGRMQPDEPVAQQVQAIIERQIGHITRLVADLQDVSRAGIGKLRLKWCRVDLGSLLIEVIDACRPAIDTRLQHFRLEAPACRIEVEGDPVRLTQVLGNLLHNASKYTPDGGHIALLLAATEAMVEVIVSDDGIGISPEVLPRIFEPFMQDSHALSVDGAGLGIGLTLVRALVEAHGGTVRAASGGTGSGSQFTMTLPRAQ